MQHVSHENIERDILQLPESPGHIGAEGEHVSPHSEGILPEPTQTPSDGLPKGLPVDLAGRPAVLGHHQIPRVANDRELEIGVPQRSAEAPPDHGQSRVTEVASLLRARVVVLLLVPLGVEGSNRRDDVVLSAMLRECDFYTRAGDLPGLEEYEPMAMRDDHGQIVSRRLI